VRRGEYELKIERSDNLVIGILLPSRGVTNMRFAWDLANLMGASTASLVNEGNVELFVSMQEGTYIHTNRCDLVEEALKEGCTHTLWLDDDMRFPNTALVHLLSRDKDIVGANYVRKGGVCVPTAVKRIAQIGVEGEGCITHPDSTGLEEVDAVGFGCVMVKAKIFNDVEFPWFECYRDRDGDRWVGEDVSFCMKAKEKGYQTWVDHDLSHEVAHVGSWEYRNEHHDIVVAELGRDSEADSK